MAEQSTPNRNGNHRCGWAPVIMDVPDTGWVDVYSGNVGFGRGTMLCRLDKPFLGRFNRRDIPNTEYRDQQNRYREMPDAEESENMTETEVERGMQI